MTGAHRSDPDGIGTATNISARNNSAIPADDDNSEVCDYPAYLRDFVQETLRGMEVDAHRRRIGSSYVPRCGDRRYSTQEAAA